MSNKWNGFHSIKLWPKNKSRIDKLIERVPLLSACNLVNGVLDLELAKFEKDPSKVLEIGKAE